MTTNEENLAQQAKELFDQALEFYNNNDYQRALQLWQQTIDLRKQLPLDNPEYKNDLAVSYRKYGLVLYELKRIEEAIEHYQHAIELGTQLLPLDNPAYKNDLARVYYNCGIALADLRRFEEAIEHYQHAIDLGTQLLPLDNPAYKNDLASAYNNCGNALDDLRRFEEAIEHYQHAIELGTQLLPLDNPAYKNDLASAYNNCGIALKDLRRFEEAIEHYQHAIELRTQLLPLDNPEYKNDLARAYNNYGSSLGYLEKFKEAEDAIDESLKISRELEEQGIYWYREDRELFFGNAIKIYLNESFNFLPELILEHLDPDNSGSAPQSEKMHQDASDGLYRLKNKIHSEHPAFLINRQNFIEEMEEAIERLKEIRAKYFTGTASGAKLTAQFYEENVGDLKKAEEILKKYVEKVPSDPVGYQQVGEFYERCKRYSEALTFFEQSIKVALQQKIEESFIFHSLKNTVHLAIDNKEFPNFMAFNATGIAFKQLNQMKEWFNTFVDSFEKTEKILLKNHWKPINEELDDDYQTWLAGYHSSMRENVEKKLKEHFKQKREAQRRSLHEVIRSLDKHLAVIVETLFNSFEQHWDKHDQAWEQANEEQRQVIETEIIQNLQNVVEGLAEKLSEEEKRFAFEELQQDLPLEIWEILKKNEQNILLLAMRMKQQKINQFASLGFGQLIEIALSKRLFYPIKTYLQKKNKSVFSDERDSVANFLNGYKPHLMLGSMVTAFNQAVHFDRTVTCQEVENLLLEGLKNFPKHHLLLEQSDKTKKTRAERLQRITKIRNNCAHPEQNMSLEETNEIYDNVIKDSEHAFCRYFIGACH